MHEPLGGERTFGSEVEVTTRSLLEVAAERLGVGSGSARIEAEFDDGRLAVLWTRTKHRVNGPELPSKTFDPPT